MSRSRETCSGDFAQRFTGFAQLGIHGILDLEADAVVASASVSKAGAVPGEQSLAGERPQPPWPENQKGSPANVANKPPAFQFYAKDWLTSETVLRMSWKDQGIYMRLLASSWMSSEPGTLPLPLSLGAKVVGLDTRLLGGFLKRNPTTFRNSGDRLVNDKLLSEWLKYKELSEKRADAARKKNDAIAEQLHMQTGGSAVAFAVAIETPPNLDGCQAHSVVSQHANGDARALAGFELFWEAYPKKIGQPAARRAWLSSVQADDRWPEVIDGLERWKQSEQWSEERYIPHPEKFLSERRWQDNPPEAKQNGRVRKSIQESIELAEQLGIEPPNLGLGHDARPALQPARTLLARRKTDIH